MIKVTLLSGRVVVLNAEMIESIESTPDTIIAMTAGKKFMVKEGVDGVVERVIYYRKAIRGFTIWQRQRVEGPGISRMIGELEEVHDLSEEVTIPQDEESGDEESGDEEASEAEAGGQEEEGEE